MAERKKDPKADQAHDDVLKEARERFKRAQAFESTARQRYIDDVKFCEGDSDNLFQWPDDIRSARLNDERPLLTVNKTRQHVLDVLNDARQSKVAIKVRAIGDGASVASAEAFNGVIRHIEYISNASSAYQHGLKGAVQGGLGWWRVLTDYAADDTFDQEIFIRRILDPLSCYLDPDIKEFDGSDARWGLVFTDMDKASAEKDHPEWKDNLQNAALGEDSWVREGTVKKAEYFRRRAEMDALWAWPDLEADPEGKVIATEHASKLDPARIAELKKTKGARQRAVRRWKVDWFLILGDRVVDEREWPGIYIPLVRCVGEETLIQGQFDRKGHVRALKDPQRMFNYNASAAVEYGALQSKSPYIGPIEAFEGLEAFWDNANRENWPYLPYNARDDDGNDIERPEKQPPPTGAPVFIQGMNDAAEQMRMVSGQYQADMGAPSNERSGVAIMQRQRQGDNATYHYLDHQSIAIRLTGKILIDLIPKIYDTPRVLRILDESGTESEITVDPQAPQAFQEQKLAQDQAKSIFNPNVGRYEVTSDVGPAFQTRRQEAFAAYTEILSQNKELTAIIGDLALRFADFPGAEEAAERLKRMVPAQALGDGPSPDAMKLQAQLQQANGLLMKTAQKLADKTAAHLNDQEKNAIAGYDAQTKRIAALKDALGTQPEKLMEFVLAVLEEAEATSSAAISPTVNPSATLTADNMAPPEQQPQAAPGIPGSGLGPAPQPAPPSIAPGGQAGEPPAPDAPPISGGEPPIPQ